MADRILRINEVLQRTGMARSSLYLAISEGRFPKPRKLSERASGWLEADVDDWIANLPTAGSEAAQSAD